MEGRLERAHSDPDQRANGDPPAAVLPEAEPLLGVTALESGGFEGDPRNEDLKRLPAILLKACGR